MIFIELTHGQRALVDDGDYEELNRYRWRYLKGKGYAYRSQRKSEQINGKRRNIYMHRVIVEASVGEEVDHINGDKLDNRRSNLRACSHSQNQWNRGALRSNTSGYKGVYRDKPGSSLWRAQIGLNGRVIYLGVFPNRALAAKAYNQAAIEYHGQFANIC